jgi:hypothetical protein
VYANPAALTLNGINLEIRANGVKPAQISAQATFSAPIRVYYGPMTLLKILPFLYLRFQDEVEIGGIHVSIAQDLIAGQRCKGTQQTGLAGSALAAYDNELLNVMIFLHDF